MFFVVFTFFPDEQVPVGRSTHVLWTQFGLHTLHTLHRVMVRLSDLSHQRVALLDSVDLDWLLGVGQVTHVTQLLLPLLRLGEAGVGIHRLEVPVGHLPVLESSQQFTRLRILVETHDWGGTFEHSLRVVWIL